MLWLWILLGIIAALILLPQIIGRIAPEHYEAEVTRDMSGSAEEVWTALLSSEAHPISGRQCRGVEALESEAGLPAWKEDLGQSQITVRVVKAEEPNLLQYELSDCLVPMTANGEISLEPTESGCRVNSRRAITIRNGTWHVPYFRTLLWLINGTKMGVKDHLKRVDKSIRAAKAA